MNAAFYLKEHFVHIFLGLNEWRQFRKTLPTASSLGFAPTMGNLHAGHASLFARSKRENDYTVTSLFVNPTQFNQRDDFIHYPRTLEQDLELMEQNALDFCLIPNEDAMYAGGYNYQIIEHQLCQYMEGKYRPGHFNGVLTVVMKLLNIVKPQRAYFGEKDFQQYQLIHEMGAAFFMDVDIIACPTIREDSGLAYSSRNNRLNVQQKNLANEFARIFHQKNKSCAEITQELEHLGIFVEYLEEHEQRRYTAVTIGAVRLIDNYSVA